MKGPLLITRPENDPPTHYLAKWSEEIIDKAKEKNVRVIDLHRDRSTRKGTIGRMEKMGPALVVLNGHGDDNCVTGHENEVILKASDKKAVESKIIFAKTIPGVE